MNDLIEYFYLQIQSLKSELVIKRDGLVEAQAIADTKLMEHRSFLERREREHQQEMDRHLREHSDTIGKIKEIIIVNC